MKVIIDTKALKDLKKIDKKEAKNIVAKIEILEKYPNIPNIKKLTNFYPPFRLRVEDYRILFDVEDNQIVIYRVLHRKDSYN